MNKLRFLAIIIISFLLFSGCGKNISQTIPSSNTISIGVAGYDVNNVQIPRNAKTTFNAVAVNSKNEIITNADIQWKVLGGIGEIDNNGVFTATNEGFGTVEASVGDIKAQKSVEVFISPMLTVYDKICNYFIYQSRIPFTNLYDDALESALLSAYGSPEGFINSLNDPCTRYIDKSKDSTDARLNPGSFGGIGVYLKEMSGKIALLFVMPGQPANVAGLVNGDIVLEVDGTSVSGMSINDVSNLIRGTPGSTVKLKIMRGQNGLEFNIIRQTIQAKSVYGQILNGNIAYLRVISFGTSSEYELETAYNDLSGTMEGVILDLRWNGGGELYNALDIASLFLPYGKDLMWYKMKDGAYNNFTSSSGTKINLPMIILVNKDSASASEIVASALIENGAAELIGMNTYGKGTIQTRMAVNNYYLYITTAEFFTPSKTAIEGVGLIPDKVVPMTDEDFFSGNDPQLTAGITELNSKITVNVNKIKYKAAGIVKSNPVIRSINNIYDRPVNNAM